MDRYRTLDLAVDTHTVEELLGCQDRTDFRICGVVMGATQRLAKKDNRPWASFNVATKEGSLTAHLYSNAFPNYARHLIEGKPVIIIGNSIRGDDGVRFAVREIYDLDMGLSLVVSAIDLTLRGTSPETSGVITELFRQAQDGESGTTTVRIHQVDELGAACSKPTTLPGWTFDIDSFRKLLGGTGLCGSSRHRQGAAFTDNALGRGLISVL